MISKKVPIASVLFHFDCIVDFEWLENCEFSYCIKNPSYHSWHQFYNAMEEHNFDSVLDLNRATRFENYLDHYIDKCHDKFKAIHVSGYINDYGRTPIIESQQDFLLDKLKTIDAPVIIEGLFSPGDFQSIRNEIQLIQDRTHNTM